jgi:hypothetical protein
MRTYKEIKNEIYGTTFIEFTDGDKIGWIPTDPANTDYQRYLAWLEDPEAEQSTPIDTEDE